MFEQFHAHWYVMLGLLFWGHVLADYPLQGDFLAKGKDPNGPLKEFFPWTHALSAHAMIHAGFVFLFTGSLRCALLEWFSHALIDYAKCAKWIDLDMDQFLHYLMKVVYVLLIFTLSF
jgi:hypothetical protein